MRTNSQPPWWRRFTGWVAIYALALQVALVGLTAPDLPAGPGLDQEICMHDADAGGAAPGAPTDKHHGLHCALCMAAAHHAVTPARIPVPAVMTLDHRPAFWPKGDRDGTSSSRHSDHQSRAPPTTA